MEYKLRVTTLKPTDGTLVLEAETPLSGLKFVEVAGRVLRRSIDHIDRYKHQTLGALATYEMNVPQAMAIESGRYEDSSVFTVIVDENLLADFIFYGASISNAATHRPCYPYMTNETTIVSYVDELGFMGVWADLGYPDWISKNANGDFVIGTTDGSSTDTFTCNGIGCEGCTIDCQYAGTDKKPGRPITPVPYPPKPGPRPPFPPGPGPEPPPRPDDPPFPPPPDPGTDADRRRPNAGTICIDGEYYDSIGQYAGVQGATHDPYFMA